MVESPSVEGFKKCVDDLRTWFGGGAGLMGGLMILEVFSNLSESVIL